MEATVSAQWSNDACILTVLLVAFFLHRQKSRKTLALAIHSFDTRWNLFKSFQQSHSLQLLRFSIYVPVVMKLILNYPPPPKLTVMETLTLNINY